MTRSRQLPLTLGLPPRMELGDFVAGESNRAALDLILRWPDWPVPTVVLIGPKGSGKTHLVSIWAARSAAQVVPSADLGRIDPLRLAAAGPIVVEDVGRGVDETALFHVLNAAREAGRDLLLTTQGEPGGWGLHLPDLLSRLRAAAPMRLSEPDDALLEALLAKLFADRQTTVDPQVLRWVARRMERSFEAAASLVERLDREALANKGPVTRTLAADVIADLCPREPELPGLDPDVETDHNPS